MWPTGDAELFEVMRHRDALLKAMSWRAIAPFRVAAGRFLVVRGIIEQQRQRCSCPHSPPGRRSKPTGSAGHAGATANLKLTFRLDQSAGADQSSVCSQLLDKFEMYSRRLPIFASGDAVVALELW